MNAFEYVLSCIKANEEDFEEKDAESYFIPDEKIRLLSLGWPTEDVMKHHLNMDLLNNLFEDEWNGCIISKSDVNTLKKTEVHIDEEVKEWLSDAKYPYYRIRGKKIPVDLAEKLISTSKRFCEETGLINILCDFIFEDGTIGLNHTTSKYPHVTELFSDAIRIKKKIPGLDLIIAISKWDNMPDEAWEVFLNTNDISTNYAYGEYDKYTGRLSEYKDFEKNIEIGIWIHDDKIEILNPGNASAKYMEYIASESYEDKKRFAAKVFM